MIRSRITLAALAATGALALPTMALAAGNSISVKAPKHAKAGKSVKTVTSGRAAKQTNLAIFVDGSKCAKSATVEATHPNQKEVVSKTVKGKFKETVKFQHSAKGSHYICAYLASGRHASAHYTTK